MSHLALTTVEVSALLDIPSRKVWGEIDRVFEGLPSPPRLDMDAVIYLKVEAIGPKRRISIAFGAIEVPRGAPRVFSLSEQNPPRR
jgi:hypothetical protein